MCNKRLTDKIIVHGRSMFVDLLLYNCPKFTSLRAYNKIINRLTMKYNKLVTIEVTFWRTITIFIVHEHWTQLLKLISEKLEKMVLVKPSFRLMEKFISRFLFLHSNGSCLFCRRPFLLKKCQQDILPSNHRRVPWERTDGS